MPNFLGGEIATKQELNFFISDKEELENGKNEKDFFYNSNENTKYSSTQNGKPMGFLELLNMPEEDTFFERGKPIGFLSFVSEPKTIQPKISKKKNNSDRFNDKSISSSSDLSVSRLSTSLSNSKLSSTLSPKKISPQKYSMLNNIMRKSIFFDNPNIKSNNNETLSNSEEISIKNIMSYYFDQLTISSNDEFSISDNSSVSFEEKIPKKFTNNNFSLEIQNLEKISPRYHRLIQHFYDSEQSYIQSLQVVHEYYYLPLRIFVSKNNNKASSSIAGEEIIHQIQIDKGEFFKYFFSYFFEI